jgi:metallo-beta-lactamase class B
VVPASSRRARRLAGRGAPRATGSLDKEVIRSVIRSHVNEVKTCYELELTNMPDLFGRVWVEFTIAASGEVVASKVLPTSTTRHAPVETCTAASVRRWRFPKPIGGGVVIVTYPFVLVPEPEPILIFSPDGTSSFDLTVLDVDTIVHRSMNAQGIPSNGLIVVTERGLLLVDTAWTEAQTETVLAWGESRLGRPWIGAVITHDHADRDGGLGALQRRHIPVAALDLTVAKMAKRGVRGVTTLFAASAREIKDPRGFEAFYPGPGHATDNIVLSFPKVLFGGCLIKSMEARDLGFTGDADLAHWPEAVRRVARRYEENHVPVVPGHGDADMTAGVFQHTLDLLAAAQKNAPRR